MGKQQTYEHMNICYCIQNTFFLIAVSSLGHVQAINSSNPECVDLERLQSTMTDAIKAIKVARVSVKCKPNSNCTGIQYNKKYINKLAATGA
jgi:hypothetical protein